MEGIIPEVLVMFYPLNWGRGEYGPNCISPYGTHISYSLCVNVIFSILTWKSKIFPTKFRNEMITSKSNICKCHKGVKYTYNFKPYLRGRNSCSDSFTLYKLKINTSESQFHYKLQDSFLWKKADYPLSTCRTSWSTQRVVPFVMSDLSCPIAEASNLTFTVV